MDLKYKLILFVVMIIMIGTVGAVRIYSNYGCEKIIVDFINPVNATIYKQGANTATRWIDGNGFLLLEDESIRPEEPARFSVRCLKEEE